MLLGTQNCIFLKGQIIFNYLNCFINGNLIESSLFKCRTDEGAKINDLIKRLGETDWKGHSKHFH